MQKLKIFSRVLFGLALVASLSVEPSASAQEPHYLHALSDLRTARDYIQFDHNAPGGDVRHHAVEEINKAIEEIKHAAWDDGKNTQFAPPAQGVTSGWAPLHQAENWMQRAKGDVEKGIDPPQNTGLRERAIGHITEAQRHIHRLIDMGVQ
jgi:hypothetical protein